MVGFPLSLEVLLDIRLLGATELPVDERIIEFFLKKIKFEICCIGKTMLKE
jgi:hypothetical protein